LFAAFSGKLNAVIYGKLLAVYSRMETTIWVPLGCHMGDIWGRFSIGKIMRQQH
jgi:hypothetical protein